MTDVASSLTRRQPTAPDPAATDDDDERFARLDPHVFRRFFAFVLPYRTTLAGALASVVLYTAAQAAVPLAIRFAIDSAIGRTAMPLGLVLSLFAALIIFNGIFSFLQEWVTARLEQRVIFDLRRAMFAHLQDVSLSFLDQTHVGPLMSRLQGEVN